MSKAGLFAVRRAKKSDMEALGKATGGRIVTNIDDLGENDFYRFMTTYLNCSLKEVLTKHSDSQYVDDAIYYIGRSYFSLREFYKSKKYFNQLVDEYPNSKYYNESRLWVEYSQLKLDLLDSVFIKTSIIENEMKLSPKEIDRNLFFLLHNLKGDFFIKKGNFDKALVEFEKALEFTDLKSKKIKMYSKLVYICEAENKFKKASKYLEKIIISSNNKDTRVESFRKWITIKKFDKKYGEIIFGIQDRINLPDFESDKLQDEFSIELATIFMENQDFEQAKSLFNDIINTTKQNTIKCEAYYWLGYISLMKEFDLNLSEEYFDLVIETMRNSKFSKKSEIYLNEIESYNDILEEYDMLSSNNLEIDSIENNQNTLMRTPNNSSNHQSYKDSLLFIISEKLYFDFNQPKLAVNKYEEIINLYPNSEYAIRSKKIINKLSGIDDFNDSYKVDSLKILRDSAWNELAHNKNKSIEMFEDIALKFDDYQSYYSLGIIYEEYAYQPNLGIKYYLESFNKSEDESFKKNIKNKLLLLEEVLKNKIDSINQKFIYLDGFNFLLNKFDLDSANSYFIKSSLLNESKELNQSIDDYLKQIDDIKFNILRDSILVPGWKHDKYNTKELDSILFDLANTSYWFFRNDSLADQYIDIIMVNDSLKYYENDLKNPETYTKPYLNYYKLEAKIKNNDFSVDSNFQIYSLKSKKYLDFYNTIVTFEDDYRKNLLEYDSLLKYLSENIHDNMKVLESDTLNMEQLNKIQLPSNMKNNILPDINIDINIKPNNE